MKDIYWIKKLNGVNILIAIIVAAPITWWIQTKTIVEPLNKQITFLEKNNETTVQQTHHHFLL